MAAFNFPNSPNTNDIHTENGVSFKWNGTIWLRVGTNDLIEEGNTKAEVIDTGSDGRFVVTTEGSERLRIISDGKIGINRSSNLGSFGRQVLIDGTVGLNNDSGTVGVGFHKGVGVCYGYIGTGAWAVNGGDADDFGINVGSTGDLLFGANSVERLRITSAGLMGLGTNNPSRRLHVKSAGANATQIALIDNDSTNEVFQIGQQSDGDCFVSIRDDSGNTKISFDASGDSFFNGGNIGLGGITSPLWTTGGGMHLNDAYGIGFGNGGSGRPDFQIVTTGGATLDFRCGFGADTADIVMSTSGYFGIGDTSPTKPLTVGTATPVVLLDDQSSRTLEIRGPSTTHNATVLTTSNHDLLLGTNNTERLRINTSGQVLIGTSTNPAFSSRKLTVSDTTSGATTAIEIRSATNGTGRLYFTDSTSSGNAGSYAGKVLYDHNTDHMAFWTNGNVERLRIDSNGHMGLGVTPSAWATNGDFRGLQVGSGTALYGRLGGDADRGGVSVNYYHTGSAEKYIAAGNANNLYMVDGEFVFKRAASGSANGTITWDTRCKINTEFGVKAENTCKAWLCYRGENGQEGILDDYNVATVSDEATGTFAVTFSRNLTQHSGGKYSLTFGSHNWSPCMLIAGVAYTSSHGSNNPWWGMEDNFVRIHTMRSDSNTLVDAEVFFMAVHGDTGDV